MVKSRGQIVSTQVCSSSSKLKFGPFELSSRERVLRHKSVVLPLGRLSLDILIYLAERPSEIIAEKELMDRAWSGATIEEARLRVHMAVIRKALYWMRANVAALLNHLDEVGNDQTSSKNDLIESPACACSKNTAKSIRCLCGIGDA
jgi:DNA-binding winged helix-turn-helix (wHTH) protein